MKSGQLTFFVKSIALLIQCHIIVRKPKGCGYMVNLNLVHVIENLEAERLILRPFMLSDAPVVTALASNKNIYDTTLNIPHPYTEDMAVSWIRNHPEDVTERKLYHWAIVRKEDRALLGCISIGIRPNPQMGEIGYWLGEPYWSKGYGTEAAKAIMAYGFNTIGLNKVYGRHFVSNPASGAIMKKCGMQLEGVHRDDVVKDGRFVDIAYLGILRSEFGGASV